MRVNEPVTRQEYQFKDDLLVSTTDTTGRITHCNAAFSRVSGYDYEELIGQPHNLVRHPDMPEEAFRDMWATIGRGRPWTGIVKNRRKNGDHYWVRANVTPVLERGKPVGYMSVREAPTRAEIAQAEQLYARIVAQRGRARPSFKLHAGRVRQMGLRDLPARLHRLNVTQRLMAGLIAIGLGSAAVAWLLPGLGAWGPSGLAVLGSIWLVLWFQFDIQRRLDAAEEAANNIASCNLIEPVPHVHPHPLSAITRALGQIQINLRAVVGDARSEVQGTVTTAQELARAGHHLSQRTEVQSSAVQRSAAAMDEMASAVRQTAQTASVVAGQSTSAAAAAQQSGHAVGRVNETFNAIEASSKRIGDIVQVIEGIAFQTNILALNAAVEAARAGESGRGFAVVASEVRALAQRSAGAAKEVRQVIQGSVEQVGVSAREMDEANATIRRTVDEVDRVGTMMSEIQRATTEQSVGIADVNTAVADLERMTQENAAMVEETAAAVDALHQRSETLKRALNVFRL